MSSMKNFLSISVFTETQKPYLAMLLTQFLYAGMALLSKAAIDVGMTPCVFAVYRQAFASLALAPFSFLLERKQAPPMSCPVLSRIFCASLFGMTLSLNLYYVALNYTSTTFAAASTNTIPAITFIVATFLSAYIIVLVSYFHLVFPLQGPLLKIYPTKICLTSIQCFFNCILSAIWAIGFDRNLSSWKLGLNLQLSSVLYCV
ncbi:hypothetical protein IFM89_017760, partial [Coptis chinensis]